MNVTGPKGPGSGFGGNEKGESLISSLRRRTTLTGWVKAAVVGLNAVVLYLGVSRFPELTLLAIGVAAIAWAMDHLAAFKPKHAEGNALTRAGKRARSLAAFGALIIGAAVYYIPALPYRGGAGLLAALLGASTVLLALGKAYDIKTLLASLAVCVAVGVGALALPEPPRTKPDLELTLDVETAVTLKIELRRADGQTPYGVDVDCFALLPRTWFESRRSVYAGRVIHTLDGGFEAELPYDPLGYEVVARSDSRNDGPRFTSVDVTSV